MAYFDVMYITNWSKPWMQAYYAQVQEDVVRQIYLNYVRGTIFVPSGVSAGIHVSDWDASSQNVRYYNFQDTSLGGYSNDNNYDTMGPRGFVMRSSEVCRVMSKLEQAEIVSPTVRGWIKTLRLGVVRTTSGGEVFYYKTGGNEDALGRGRENILVALSQQYPGRIPYQFAKQWVHVTIGCRHDGLRDRRGRLIQQALNHAVRSRATAPGTCR